jgi:hypothetical protein
LALSCEAGGTAETVSVIASAEDRARLASIVGDHSRPLKHVQRAKIVIYSADRLPALEVARRSEVSRPAVWRWRRHYAHAGVERLLREGSRKPGKPPVPLSTVAKIVSVGRWKMPLMPRQVVIAPLRTISIPSTVLFFKEGDSRHA